MRATPRPARPLARTEPRLAARPASPPALPDPFAAWFARRGWQPRAHQLALLDKAAARRSTLLIAPTGGGQDAGRLPAEPGRRWRRGQRAAGERGVHTLYISPLKALAVDVARNLLTPVERDGSCRSASRRAPATRSVARRQRQRVHPPDILLTTPEQLALLLSHADAPRTCSPTSRP